MSLYLSYIYYNKNQKFAYKCNQEIKKLRKIVLPLISIMKMTVIEAETKKKKR